MKINVLLEDLLLQNSAHSEKCAIARALKREFPDSFIWVCLDNITIGEMVYDVSPELYSWQVRNVYEKFQTHEMCLDFNPKLMYVSLLS